ncbi:MAG: 50S ribosomal protein L30e [Caldisphaera sp.]|jgi:large subunit ribosomal protein L30e|nr:50S ribosomal protein L30e [Caldisphaera sp.]
MSVSLEKELKNLLKSGKYNLGSKNTLKSVLRGEAKMVILADNMINEIREKIEKSSKMGNIPVFIFKGTSVELGALLGKPFKVSAITVIDPGESRILDLSGTA